MKIIFAIFTTTFFYLSTFAQNKPTAFKSTTDSLQYAYSHATTDTAKLSILLKERGVKYIEQADLILDLYQQGIELAQKLGDKKSLSRLYHNKGLVYAFGKIDEGTAFQYYQKALQTAENINYTEGCALSHYSMALVYDHQGFQDKMYQSLAQSRSYIERGYTPLLLRPLLSIQTLLVRKHIDEAYALGKKTIGFVEQNASNSQDKVLTYSFFLETLNHIPQKQKEVKYYSDKIVQLLKTADMANNTESLRLAVKICFDIKEPALALQYAEQVFALKNEDNLTVGCKADAHLFVAQYHENQKNYPLSIQHYKDYMTLRTGVVKRVMTEEAGRKVIKIESERDLALKQAEIEQQKLYTLLAGVIAVLVLGLGGAAYYFYRREQARKQELAALNATKDRLFAILSHDLLSPMATMKNYLSLMDWGMMSQAEFAESSDGLKIKVNNLYNLLENVLHWSITQMQGIKPKIEQVAVAEVINEQIKLLEPIVNSKQISITQSIPNDLMLNIDKNHLSLVVRNLLQNALKFTNTGGNIVFNSENIERSKIQNAFGTEGGKTLIKITDNGIGMSKEIQNELFKTDKNVNRTGTAEEGGTGLGLILTKELVELNGGKIEVASEVGHGTTFTLQFA